MKKNVLNVCYAANNAYVMQVGVSVVSLLENNKDLSDINIFILNSDFTDSNKRVLMDLVHNYNRNLYIINGSEELQRLEGTGLDVEVNHGGALYSKTLGLEAYIRFFIVKLVPMWVDRILYLDCDTIVNGSLSELVDKEMKHCIEAVIDCWPQKYNKIIGLDMQSKYYNAGVQLINLAKWREENVLDMYLQHISSLKKPYRLFDQDIMNIVLEGRIEAISPKYNMMFILREYEVEDIFYISGKDKTTFYTKEEIEEAKRNPTIIHYAGDLLGKPWRSPDTDAFTKKWKYYFMKSPWAKDGLRKSQKINLIIWYLKVVKISFERMIIFLESYEKKVKRTKYYMDGEVEK